MDCKSEAASHYAGCDCNEAHWQNEVARLTRERDEARERAESLSRELLAAIQARDSYRASADLRVGMRREFEELLGCGDTTGEEAFERGLIRLRGLLATESRATAAEARAKRLANGLREIRDTVNDPLGIAVRTLGEDGK